jgi:predicted RNase H-like nuclease
MKTGHEMRCVAGVDGTPGGWAVVIMTSNGVTVKKVEALSTLFDERSDLEVVAIDVPIGLLDYFEKGGRS